MTTAASDALVVMKMIASVDCRECGARAGEIHVSDCDVYALYEWVWESPEKLPGAKTPAVWLVVVK